ncbi:hypothetical protein ACFPRL_19880 [Pseudoclavibacter helvolus]
MHARRGGLRNRRERRGRVGGERLLGAGFRAVRLARRLGRRLRSPTLQRVVSRAVRVRESALRTLAAAVKVISGTRGGARRGPPLVAGELLGRALRIPCRLTGGPLRVLRALLERPLAVLRALFGVALPVSCALLALQLDAVGAAAGRVGPLPHEVRCPVVRRRRVAVPAITHGRTPSYCCLRSFNTTPPTLEPLSHGHH